VPEKCLLNCWDVFQHTASKRPRDARVRGRRAVNDGLLTDPGAVTPLLIDEVMPSFHRRIRHSGVFCASAARCVDAAVQLNVLCYPVVRALMAARSIPEGGPRIRTLRIADMTSPPLSWLKLAEQPGREMALGQIARSWQPGAERVFLADAEEFRQFDRPGYAKIALSVHAEPHDAETSELVIETRVWITDPESRRRFDRYWLLVGPFSALIRRLTMQALAAELGKPARHQIVGEIDIARPPEVIFDVVADERNEPRFNPRLTDVEKITPGPIGQGIQFRARTTGRRRGVNMIIEFTEFAPPHRLSSLTRLRGMDISYSLTFEPTAYGTRMRWSGDLRPRGALALLKLVLIWIGRRQEQAIWGSLKRYLESDAIRHSRFSK
jgi:Polyketide cyclase / dehydrase and lipid transport